jgi:polyferredoxin
VGTLSEWLWKAGRSVFWRNFALPRRLDLALRSLKYVLLSLFVYVVAAMSVDAIRAFLESPYGIIADVKMLNLFRFMSVTTAAVLGILAVASVFVQNFWCRYLCPYGALLGLVALASPLRIRRDQRTCIDCAKCARACPSRLPVDRLVTIRSAECLGCMECVHACPAEGALDMKLLARRRVEPWMMAAGVAVLFCGLVGWARLSGHWASNVPEPVYRELIPHAAEFGHPR